MLLAAAQDGAAAPITVPAGLSPGDEYRLAFVTSTVRFATSSDIADYNAFVTAAANGSPQLAALGTTWTAIASTLTADARDNTGTNPSSGPGVPIYNLAGLLVASSNADLWDGAIDNTISLTEDGSATSNSGAWSGTLNNGIAETLANGGRPLGDLALGTAGNSSTGYVFQPIGFSWIAGAVGGNNLNQNPLYAISGTLVVPEPQLATLLVMGLIALAAFRRAA